MTHILRPRIQKMKCLAQILTKWRRIEKNVVNTFEIIPLMTHERRPRIQKMKCLAQKLTKWQRIEKLWQKREVERFSKIERFALCKSCYRPSTKWLSFRPGWSDFAETGLYGFIITNGKKSRSANVPNSSEFEELRNFQAMGRIRPPPWLIGLRLMLS